MICSQCGQSLTETNFNKHFVYLCLNWECPLYRHIQETRVKVIDPEVSLRRECNRRRKLLPGYQTNLVRGRLNYRLLRKAGIRSKVAARYKSDKRTREILNDN